MTSPMPRPVFTTAQLEALTRRAITPETATAFGVRSVSEPADLPEGSPSYWTKANGYLPGLLFPWRSPDGETVEYQLRPDEPVEYDGDVRKYVFRKDAPSILTAARVGPETGPLLMTEGTCQTISASAYAPEDFSVYGIAGCQSWMKRGVPTRDLAVVDGRDVFIVLDADAATNLDVYTAGTQLREACVAQGAATVRFVRIPGGKTSGLDDVLAAEVEPRRTRYLQRLVELAESRPKAERPELPAVTKPKPKKRGDDGDGSPFFDGEKLKVATLASAVAASSSVALTAEDKIALYSHGVYRIDGTGFISALGKLLGEDFRTGHRVNVQEYMVGILADADERLADRMTEPLMNTRNVMVDLRTGEAIEHDPKFRSSVQFDVDYDPAATCPTYEQWAKEQIGDQLDDLEEAVSTMLDPSQTPTKAVFLFGPSRSGKSTYLRLMQAVAGINNVSAVSLHALNEDRFAVANVYGKALNIGADLKATHVDDISVFKLMTGEDLLTGNRKYGAQFSFTNRALFAFSANELPTVGESSRAYSERIKPFHFSTSFAGREDDTLEDRLKTELPGILLRWVKAWKRRNDRGVPLPTNPAVRERFEQASDRVRAFVADCCEVVPVVAGKGGTVGGTESTTTELYNAFRSWAEDEGRTGMAKGKVRDRLRNVPGVVETVSSGKSRGWNVRVRPRGEWGGQGKVEGLPPTDASSEPCDKSGTLYLSTHPAQTRDASTLEVDLDERLTHFRMEQGGLRGTKFQSPGTALLDAFLTDHASPKVPANLCPDCDRERQLVPPAMFWRACLSCNPETFVRR